MLQQIRDKLAEMALVERGLPRELQEHFAAVNGNGSTFLAPITAYPTTTLTMALWNGEPDDGKTYVVDTAFAFLASGTPGAGGALLACVTASRQAINPTAYANTVVGSLSGGRAAGASASGAGGTRAVFANAITLAGTTPPWVVLEAESAAGTGATIATHAVVAKVEGRIKLPPGWMLGLSYLSGAGTTPLFGFGVTWYERRTGLALS